MDSVWQILDRKGHEIWSVGPDDTVYHALELMAEKDVGVLVVLDHEKVVGIFSERDYARRVYLQGRNSTDTRIREVMSANVLYVRPGYTVDECMAIMTENHIRHLPVVDDENLIGVISIGDLVKAVISEQSFIIEQLENYISGGRK